MPRGKVAKDAKERKPQDFTTEAAENAEGGEPKRGRSDDPQILGKPGRTEGAEETRREPGPIAGVESPKSIFSGVAGKGERSFDSPSASLSVAQDFACGLPLRLRPQNGSS